MSATQIPSTTRSSYGYPRRGFQFLAACDMPLEKFRVEVDGNSRDLPPLVRDEVYRIACEALRNSFKHAHAERIDVEIRYEARRFRMLVRDDGRA